MEKEKAEHQDRVLEKFYYYLFFNIVLTWKIVGASKAFVLYVYIDLKHISDINIFETRVS